MLVLSRRVGEKIVIGNGVFVEVLAVSGEGVRLGIVAPEKTSIHRFEVYEEIEQANHAADAVLGELEKGSLQNLAAHIRINQQL